MGKLTTQFFARLHFQVFTSFLILLFKICQCYLSVSFFACLSRLLLEEVLRRCFHLPLCRFEPIVSVPTQTTHPRHILIYIVFAYHVHNAPSICLTQLERVQFLTLFVTCFLWGTIYCLIFCRFQNNRSSHDLILADPLVNCFVLFSGREVFGARITEWFLSCELGAILVVAKI